MAIDNYIILSDYQLITLSIDGDSVAFENLFNRYRDAIYQLYQQRLGGNNIDINDLLQETFVKVFLNLDKYDQRFTFGQWIYAIAKNTFIDYMRKRRDDVSIDTAGKHGGELSPVANEATPEEHFILSQQRLQLESYLTRMTPQYKLLIDLRFFKDMSYDQIAEELHLPIGTVKTQIHRAREQLCRFILEGDIMS